MKNIKILALVVVLVGITCGVFFWWLATITAPDILAPGPVPAEPAATTAEAGDLRGRGRITDLLAKNERLECSVKYEATASAAPIEGMIFMHEGQLRGDFIVPLLGTTTSVSSMVISGEVLYVWAEVSGAWSGVKKNLASTTEEVGLDAREPVPLEAPVMYECQQWKAYDPSVFTPPANILFRDLAEIQSSGMEYGTTFESVRVPEINDSCAACALVTEDGPREQCEIRFGCGLQAN